MVVVSDTLPELPGIIITDSPTKREELSGKLNDTYWKTINKVLEELGYTISQFHITSVIKCSPEVNRYPEDEEISACSENLLPEMLKIKPKCVLFLGEHCAQYYIKKEFSLMNKAFQTRFCNVVIVTHNPKGLIENTDKYLEFKSAVRKFLQVVLQSNS
jgi:uracil-DNA glycosylase family 4